jgi:hypothetical protein
MGCTCNSRIADGLSLSAAARASRWSRCLPTPARTSMKHTTPKSLRPRHVAPPLPGDRRATAPRRAALPQRRPQARRAGGVSRGAGLRGRVARGADPERAYRRHVVGPHHEHWLCGYDAGQRAAEQAAQRYLRDQLASPSPADTAAPASTTASSASTADSAAPIPRAQRARDPPDARMPPTTTHPVLARSRHGKHAADLTAPLVE